MFSLAAKSLTAKVGYTEKNIRKSKIEAPINAVMGWARIVN